MSGKLGADGKFKQFPGTTVICPVVLDIVPWQQIEDFLKNSVRLSQFYAPLPAKSFHVTVCGHRTFQYVCRNNDFDEVEWTSFLHENTEKCKKIAAASKGLALNPRFEHLGTYWGILSASFSLNNEKQVRDFCHSVECQPSIPCHMTLAYQTAYPLPERDMEFDKEISDLSRLVGDLFAKIQNASWLQSAEFCYFDSMLHFEPWDGSTETLDEVKSKCKKIQGF